MKKILLLILSLLIIPNIKAAECCASQGGLSGSYTEDGYAICMDETPSYEVSCRRTGTPTPPPSTGGGSSIIKGCTNQNAKNYNGSANRDDGSCVYYIYGCTNKDSFNYNVSAEKDDGSCVAKVYGCPDSRAINYKEGSNTDDGSCQYMAEIEEEKNIYYKTDYEDDDSLLAGEEKVMKKGKNGRAKAKYRVVMDANGKELSRIKIFEEVLEYPEKEIVRQGSWDTFGELTIWLYISNLVCFIILYFHARYGKEKDYYILRSIMDHTYGTKVLPSILPHIIKGGLYFLYFIVTIPVYVDFICLLKNWIVKRL